MGVLLLNAGVADEESAALDCTPAGDKSLFPMRVTAIGGFAADTVSIQYSPKMSGTDWIEINTLADDGTLTITAPVARLRAVCGSSMTGAATVIVEPSH